MKPLPRPFITLIAAAAVLSSCDSRKELPPEPVREISGTPSSPASAAPAVALPPEMEKPVPPETARADFEKIVSEQTQFRADRTRRAQAFYSKFMQKFAASLQAEDPGISEETFLSYNDKIGAILSRLDEEGLAFAAEMQRHQQIWSAKNWSGYVLLEHFPLPPATNPDMSSWPRTAPESLSVTAARTDFLERREIRHRDVIVPVETSLFAAWRQCEQHRASLSVPASRAELVKIFTVIGELRAGLDTSIRDILQTHAESEKLWKEWEAKAWDGYVIEKKPPGADKISLLPERQQ